jgi:DNA polymerase
LTAPDAIPAELPAADPEALRREAGILGPALRAQVEYFEALGVTEWPRDILPPPPAPRPETAASRPPARPARETKPPAESGRPDRWAPAARDLAELARLTRACRACPLCSARPAAPAPGRGAPGSILAVVGLDPGMYEGPRGELLSAMLDKGLELRPDEYYIAALVKCASPSGDEPSPAAARVCGPIVRRELALVRPRIVLALGEPAGRNLSGRDEPLALLRPVSHTLPGLPESWLRITYGLDHLLSSVELKR